MFKKIAFVFDKSPGASHALTSAIALAKTLDSELQTVTVVEPPAAYTGVKFYEQLQETAKAEGRKQSIAIPANLATRDEVEATVEFLRQEKKELLIPGLNRYTPRVARLWSTVFALEQEAPCSVPGIH
jgi:hypothetical protein